MDRAGQPELIWSLVAASLLVAGALVYELAVGTRRGQRVDEAVKAWWLPARVSRWRTRPGGRCGCWELRC